MMENIDLAYNNIGVSKTFGGSVESDTSLESIALEKNKIGAKGQTLVEALKVNTSLEKIALGLNNIGAKAAKHLVEALKVNTSLKLFGWVVMKLVLKVGVFGGGVESEYVVESDLCGINNKTVPKEQALAEALKVNKTLKNLVG